MSEKRKANSILEEQYKEQGECCCYCKDKIPFESITRDHFDPVSKGSNFVNNKVFACRFCNSMKGDKNIIDFKKFIIERADLLLIKIKSKNYNITENQIFKLQKYNRILNSIEEMSKNNYKPKIVFT
jgi:hypothetical protein